MSTASRLVSRCCSNARRHATCPCTAAMCSGDCALPSLAAWVAPAASMLHSASTCPVALAMLSAS